LINKPESESHFPCVVSDLIYFTISNNNYLNRTRTDGHRDTRETRFELVKNFTYDQQGYVADHLSNDLEEAGTYQANFSQGLNEMAAIRRYLLVTARATKVPFPTFGGITEPFGPRAGTGPFDCRIINWRDLGRKNYCDWGLSITFAREMESWNK